MIEIVFYRRTTTLTRKITLTTLRKHGSLVVSAMTFSARGHRLEYGCPDMLFLVSFVGMTLNKCAVLRIGGPLYRESHPCAG